MSSAQPWTGGGEPVATPLCVDLDGTLIHGDTLVISLRQILCEMPWRLGRLVCSLARGRARFKQAVAECLVPEASALPYRANVVEFLRVQHAQGRRLILATAADERIARAVAAHLGIFDAIIACQGQVNLKGVQKLHAIRQLLGDSPFEYMGDSRTDVPIFLAASGAYLVSPAKEVLDALADSGRIRKVF